MTSKWLSERGRNSVHIDVSESTTTTTSVMRSQKIFVTFLYIYFSLFPMTRSKEISGRTWFNYIYDISKHIFHHEAGWRWRFRTSVKEYKWPRGYPYSLLQSQASASSVEKTVSSLLTCDCATSAFPVLNKMASVCCIGYGRLCNRIV